VTESANSGSGSKPAANQTQTESMPANEAQSAPASGNMGSADPQAPTPMPQSTVGAGTVPRAATGPRSSVPGRPGSAEPDEAADQPPATADGGGTTHGRPSGEVKT
jgi:hypothetical protein